jgi:methyl-accepting chemotaxis protein
MKNGDTKTADFKEQVEKQIPLLFKNLDNHLEDVLKFHEKYSATVEDDAHHNVRFAFTLVSLVVVFGFCISMSLGSLLSHSLTKVLTSISNAVHTSAIETNSASFQLSTASQQLSSGASAVATSLEETVASLEELSGMVNVNSSHAKEANTLSQRSKEAAEKGETEISRLIAAMHEIASGSKKIEDIISVIDDIAFQTNLLALNAAVEAARAGEQGKGFAVVADAVRTLSQRSASAAKDISNLIKDNVSKSEGGAKIAEASGAVLTDIVINVKKVADLNTEISSASEAQSQGLEQISKAMNQLDHATQENASSSEEVAASSEEMSGQARHLMVMVQDLQGVVFGEGKTPSATPTTAVAKTAAKTITAKKSPTTVISPAVKTAPKKSAVTVKKATAQNVIPFPGEKPEVTEGSDRKLAKVSGF